VPAESRVILDGQQSLIRYFKERGFPFPDVAQRKVVVDHATQEASVSFTVDPGPVADFGATEIIGLQAVEEEYLRSRLPWKEGDPFRAELLSEARSRLRETGLLATVQVKPADNLDEKGAQAPHHNRRRQLCDRRGFRRKGVLGAQKSLWARRAALFGVHDFSDCLRR
jgi:translocation and assembly module TamA